MVTSVSKVRRHAMPSKQSPWPTAFWRCASLGSGRSALEPIHYRRAESLRRNWFCNDKIEIEPIELAQVAKEVGGCLSWILFFA